MKLGENHYIFLVESPELTEYSKQSAEASKAWQAKVAEVLGYQGDISCSIMGNAISFRACLADPNKPGFKTMGLTWVPDKKNKEGAKLHRELRKLGPFIRNDAKWLLDKGWFVSAFDAYEGQGYLLETHLRRDKDHDLFLVFLPKLSSSSMGAARTDLDQALVSLRKEAQKELKYGDYLDNYSDTMKYAVL